MASAAQTSTDSASTSPKVVVQRRPRVASPAPRQQDEGEARRLTSASDRKSRKQAEEDNNEAPAETDEPGKVGGRKRSTTNEGRGLRNAGVQRFMQARALVAAIAILLVCLLIAALAGWSVPAILGIVGLAVAVGLAVVLASFVSTFRARRRAPNPLGASARNS
eukprot:TRINITY_DN17289_c0_g1_i1.p2 TRINITY_DN17289_c0_g1~~TRINITY_DN17289_c0_g1_i1.p2  ORF type:complete len:180 (+),score=29.63 TRINITY_DN17289_c0_g1_i1:50-541(+)